MSFTIEEYDYSKISFEFPVPKIFIEAFNNDREKLTFVNSLEEWKRYVERWANFSMIFLIAKYSDASIGYLVADIGKESVIKSLWIRKRYRKKGFGSKLVKHFESLAKEKGSKKAVGQSVINNKSFFESLDYNFIHTNPSKSLNLIEKKL